MFKMSLNKKKTNVIVEMDETTFEAVIQVLKIAVGDGIAEGLTEEKRAAMMEADRIINDMFYSER